MEAYIQSDQHYLQQIPQDIHWICLATTYSVMQNYCCIFAKVLLVFVMLHPIILL